MLSGGLYSGHGSHLQESRVGDADACDDRSNTVSRVEVLVWRIVHMLVERFLEVTRALFIGEACANRRRELALRRLEYRLSPLCRSLMVGSASSAENSLPRSMFHLRFP